MVISNAHNCTICVRQYLKSCDSLINLWKDTSYTNVCITWICETGTTTLYTVNWMSLCLACIPSGGSGICSLINVAMLPLFLVKPAKQSTGVVCYLVIGRLCFFLTELKRNSKVSEEKIYPESAFLIPPQNVLVQNYHHLLPVRTTGINYATKAELNTDMNRTLAEPMWSIQYRVTNLLYCNERFNYLLSTSGFYKANVTAWEFTNKTWTIMTGLQLASEGFNRCIRGRYKQGDLYLLSSAILNFLWFSRATPWWSQLTDLALLVHIWTQESKEATTDSITKKKTTLYILSINRKRWMKYVSERQWEKKSSVNRAPFWWQLLQTMTEEQKKKEINVNSYFPFL